MEFLLFNIDKNTISFKTDEYVTLDVFKQLSLKHKQNHIISLEQELAYLWFTTSLLSPGIQKGYSGDDLENEARRQYQIPDKWEPDDITKNCIEFISKERVSVETAIIELLRSQTLSTDIVQYINDYLEKIAKKKDITDTEIAQVFNYQSTLKKIIGEIPEDVKRLKKLMGEYVDLAKGVKKARGQKDVTKSMDGDDE